MIDFHPLLFAFQTARRELLALRAPAGHWVGELAGSPFATASAAAALSIVAKNVKEDVRREAYQQLSVRAVQWLAAQQTHDGGWGDAPSGPANAAATMVVRAAIHLAGQSQAFADALSKSQRYLDGLGGLNGVRREALTPCLSPDHAAHGARRGEHCSDPALLAAVLGCSALAGLTAWRDVPAMAFETAWLPRGLRRPIGAASAHDEPVRVGIGQARYFHRWPRNPIALLVRRLSVGRSLTALAPRQPPSGGLLESAAWTGFLLMGLASTGRAEHPIARRALAFLLDTVRGDASWPIVANRSVGNTAFAVNALASASGEVGALGCLDWLLSCQRTEADALPGSLAGGWACADGRGLLPDVDSTAAALSALSVLLKSGTDAHRPPIEAAATAGVNWLLSMQNDDGGWPTFFRSAGGDSPDGSGPDTTAHALRALRTWQYWTEGHTIDESIRRGMYYLAQTQQPDGSWRPRWFGNARFSGGDNPICGTSQVVLAYRDLDQVENRLVKRALEWLASAVDPGGSWGGGAPGAPAGAPAQRVGSRVGDARGPSSVEETAMAVEALLAAPNDPRWRPVLESGLQWLVRAVEESRYRQPAAIGLHPPRVWYAEKVFPLAFAVSALGQAVKLLSRPG
jgi:squalene cyclase